MDNRLSALRLSPGIVVAAAIVGLSLAGGGYEGVAIGTATALVWLLVIAAVLSGTLELAALGSQTLIAGGCLIALAGLTAFSLIWANDDGSGFADVVKISGYAGMFVLAGLTLRRRQGSFILVAIAGGILGVALIALGSRLGGIGDGDTSLASLLAAASGRLSYPIGYWNGLGALMALGVPVLVWLAAGREASRPRGWAIAALSPPLLVAYMTSSRGALLAAAIGAAVVVGFANDRPRAMGIVVVGIVATIPAFVAAGLMSGILDSPGTGAPGKSELVVALALFAGMGFAGVFGARLAMRLARIRTGRIRTRRTPAVAAMLVIGVGLLLLSGPSRLIDDFRSVPDRTDAGAGVLTVSGSGRAQFWGTALEAFAGAPLKGIGAGGFSSYWNINGTLETPTKNVHSEPLELLAELGVAGFALLAAFFASVVRAGIQRVRGPDRADAGAALGVIAAGSVGFLIDWTWQIPVVVLPILLAAVLLTGSSFAAAKPAAEETEPGAGGFSWGRGGPVIAIALVALAVPAVWAGGVLGLATSQLNASEDAYGRGEYGEAAHSARLAAQVEPWAAEPWLRLATIEQAAGNLDAARVDGIAAIDRAPQDFRPWLLLGLLESAEGNPGPGIVYALRAEALAPRVLSRVGNIGLSASGSGI